MKEGKVHYQIPSTMVPRRGCDTSHNLDTSFLHILFKLLLKCQMSLVTEGRLNIEPESNQSGQFSDWSTGMESHGSDSQGQRDLHCDWMRNINGFICK